MTPFERKIVHDAVAAVDGVHSESEGVEPSRRVVVCSAECCQPAHQSYTDVVLIREPANTGGCFT